MKTHRVRLPYKLFNGSFYALRNSQLDPRQLFEVAVRYP
jgi:hypothetical protein